MSYDPQQLELFNAASTRSRDPGEMSFGEWAEQPDVRYHGTYRSDWGHGPFAHFGDVEGATTRLGRAGDVLRGGGSARQAYYTGESVAEDEDYSDYDVDPSPQEHVGRVFARRLDMAKQKKLLTDSLANTGHAHALMSEGYEDWEIPQSVRESGNIIPLHTEHDQNPRDVRAVSKVLRSGRALSYANEIEGGKDNTSVVAPRAAQHTWEEDVRSSPYASRMAKEFAARVHPEEQSAVEFEKPPDTFARADAPLYQQTLHSPTSAAQLHVIKNPHKVSAYRFFTQPED